MARFRIPGALGLLAAVVACGDSTGTPPAPADTTAPRVVELVPAPLARDVQWNAIVTVTFTEPINWSTVGVGSFLLRHGPDTLAGTYAFGDSSASFIPDASFAPLTSYSVTLTRGIRDPTGNQLDRDTGWTFQTMGVPPLPPYRDPR
jgi:hypothetical protein